MVFWLDQSKGVCKTAKLTASLQDESGKADVPDVWPLSAVFHCSDVRVTVGKVTGLQPGRILEIWTPAELLYGTKTERRS